MAKTLVNPFDALVMEEKVITIDGFGVVKLRDLTMAESDAFTKRLLKNYDGKGDPTIDLAEATLINYEKIALVMIEPQMTVKKLQALPKTASKIIAEIVKAIDGKEDEVDDEGNSKD